MSDESSNFWATLPKPFFVLAPMANVTDAAFRRMIAKYSKSTRPEYRGGPDVTWTEFVSADGLVLATEEGKQKLLRDLIYTEAERPIVAQLFTANPDTMEKAAAIVAGLGFDGIDINMGCPDKTIEKQGAGAKLMLKPDLAVELIRAAKRGVLRSATAAGQQPIPISVKTRLGYNKDVLDSWLPVLLAEEPAAITIHARTRKEMSKVPARWERVKRAVEIRTELKSNTLIIGNGDVQDMQDAQQKAEMSSADGVMIGRAVFGTPWLFSDTPAEEYLVPERLRIAVEHTKLFEDLLGDVKSFAVMKKHFKAYVEGFSGAKELRVHLMETKTAAEVDTIIERFLQEGVY